MVDGLRTMIVTPRVFSKRRLDGRAVEIEKPTAKSLELMEIDIQDPILDEKQSDQVILNWPYSRIPSIEMSYLRLQLRR